MVDAALLDRLLGIARSAGMVIMQHYNDAAAVRYKADRSPVTAADTAAHELIARELAPLLGGLPVVSEEGWIPGPAEQAALRTFWLVDPLDGTKEFLARNGEFTVNLALIDQDQPVAGVVYAPAIACLYYAAAGAGAWKIERGDEPIRLRSAPPEPGRPLVVVESRSHPSPALEAWIAQRQVARRISAGSSLKFCRVAEGAADVYPRFGTTMEWDVAAGDCVFRWSGAAGPRFSPLCYNKPGFRNGPFVIGLEETQVHVP